MPKIAQEISRSFFSLSWVTRKHVEFKHDHWLPGKNTVYKTWVAQYKKILVVIIGHIWFLVIIQDHIWVVWALSSHTRIMFDFLETIQGSYKKLQSLKTIIFIFYWSWKNFGNHTGSYVTHKLLIGAKIPI